MWCGWCGQEVNDPASAHDSCASDLEPQRYCTRCGRRQVVQILPTGVSTKTCVCSKERSAT